LGHGLAILKRRPGSQNETQRIFKSVNSWPDKPITARILVLEDDPITQRLITKALHNHQIVAVDLCQTARAALNAGDHFDLFVLDLGLPDGDGLEVCHEIQADPKWSKTPIILLTARATTSDKVTGYRIVPSTAI